jgi:hypothetical protein
MQQPQRERERERERERRWKRRCLVHASLSIYHLSIFYPYELEIK